MSEISGIVRWFNSVKGYGFLGREGGPDVFVHYSAIQMNGYKTLREGTPVLFNVVQGEKGAQADQVILVAEEGKPAAAANQSMGNA